MEVGSGSDFINWKKWLGIGGIDFYL